MGSLASVLSSNASLGLASALTTHVGSYLSGRAQATDYETEAAKLKTQAQISRLEGNIAAAESQLELSQDYQDYYRQLSRLAASQAQQGVLGSATGQAVAEDLEREARRSGQQIEARSSLTGTSYLAKALGLTASAHSSRRKASAARLNAVSSPLSNTLNAAGRAFDIFK